MGDKNLSIALEAKLCSEMEVQGCWTENLRAEIPKRWTMHSNLVLLPQNSFSSPVWNLVFGARLWDIIAEMFKRPKVARQGFIKSNEIREPGVEMLRGSDGWVEHVDNGIRYRFNIVTNMFSRGNISEKLRVAKMDCTNEVIVDLFAGIGYFTIPFLVHAKATHVHACDINPNAIEALKVNVQLNKVNEKCTIYEGDCAKVAPEKIADRVYLGLVPSSRVGWQAACRALKCSGGTLHVHHNVNTKLSDSSSERPSSIKEAKKEIRRRFGEEICDEIRILLCNLDKNRWWKTELLHCEYLKQYAPHIDHMVYDIRCYPCADKPN